MFDFRIVLKQIVTVYKQSNCKYSEQEVIRFFKMFYKSYKEYMGFNHPFLKNITIQNIIEKLSSDDKLEYSLEDYELMIPQYFETEFLNCDYSINHFMSGTIRQMRFYEVCY